jgi:hypothetical protein
MNYQLCKEFPAFTPFIIECEKFHKVVMLYANVRRMQIRENKENNEPTVIKRRAGDNWF